MEQDLACARTPEDVLEALCAMDVASLTHEELPAALATVEAHAARYPYWYATTAHQDILAQLRSMAAAQDRHARASRARESEAATSAFVRLSSLPGRSASQRSSSRLLQRVSSSMSASSSLILGNNANNSTNMSMSGRVLGDERNSLSFLRSMSTMLGLGMAETSYCQICLEYVDVASTVALSVCGHRFCADCIHGYLASKISDGLVAPKCFFADGDGRPCEALIPPSDIQALVSTDVFEKYEKFNFIKAHADARECPHCHVLQVGNGPDDPHMDCTQCGEAFCYTHSNAHPHSTCLEYEAKMRAEDKVNQAKISQISKPCPGCKSPVEKNGGCNQMKCVTCGVHFCWLCGEKVDDGVFPEHFQWWNLRGCAGAQMSETAVEGPSTLSKIVSFSWRLLLCLVFGPPALALTLAFSVLGCCCIPCCLRGQAFARSAFASCFCVSGYALMSPFVLAACLPLVPVGLCIWCFCPSACHDNNDSATAGHAISSGEDQTLVAMPDEDNNESDGVARYGSHGSPDEQPRAILHGPAAAV